MRAIADTVCNSRRIPYERTRRVLIPGIAATVTVWLVQSALGLHNWSGTRSGDASWTLRVHIPLTNVVPLVHWDLIVRFAIAGAVSALYGAFVSSSPKQRYIAALFPVFFEIFKWLWLLRFPLPSWIDPARPPYRFMSLGMTVSTNYLVVHIVISAAAAMGLSCTGWFMMRHMNAEREKFKSSQMQTAYELAR